MKSSVQNLPLFSTHSYAKLANDDDAIEEHGPLIEKAQSNVLKYSGTLIVLNIFFFVTSLGCLALSAHLVLGRQTVDGAILLRERTFFSPPLDTFTPTWSVSSVVTKHLGSNEFIFRQDPSPHVDSAWSQFSDMGIIGLTREQVVRLGKDPAAAVKAPASWGVGDATYLAQLDGVHLAHCLNSMRKSLHYNFDYYYPNGVSNVYAAHLMHCQEALAHWLMCQPSMDLLTYNWVEGHDAPFPDFDIMRKCWDYLQLLEWQNEHKIQTINTKEWMNMSAPWGAKKKASSILFEESITRIPFGNKLRNDV